MILTIDMDGTVADSPGEDFQIPDLPGKIVRGEGRI